MGHAPSSAHTHKPTGAATADADADAKRDAYFTGTTTS